MGAESHVVWVRKETMKNADWSNGLIEEMGFEKVPDEMDDDRPCFVCLEDELLNVARASGIELLLDSRENADYVFEMNAKNVQDMIAMCKSLIIETIDIRNDEQWKGSGAHDVFGYVDDAWDDELPELLCRLLKNLRHAQQMLEKYSGYILAVEVMW